MRDLIKENIWVVNKRVFTRMAKTKKTDNTKCSQGYRITATLIHCG